MTFAVGDYESFTETRFRGLGVAKWGNAHWFFVDCISRANAPKIGQSYRTKIEALADADRVANERGYRLATKHIGRV